MPVILNSFLTQIHPDSYQADLSRPRTELGPPLERHELSTRLPTVFIIFTLPIKRSEYLNFALC